MKKLVLATASIAMLSGSAFATTARLQALGYSEIDMEGSYVHDDSRNVFLNAAKAYDNAGMAIIEYGGNGQAVGGGLTLANNDNPKAQGGFFKKMGNGVVGLYYGNESNTSSMIRVLSIDKDITAANFKLDGADNQIDLFYATKMSDMKVGVNFLYSNSDRKKDTGIKDHTNTAMAVRFGAIADRWTAHANLSLASEALYDTGTATDKQHSKGKFGLHTGGSYDLTNDLRVHGYYKSFKWEMLDDAGLGTEKTVDGKFNTLRIGLSRKMAVNATDSIWTSVHYKMIDIEREYVDTTVKKATAEITEIPLTVGFEAKATDWLTIRGSFSQMLIGGYKVKNTDQLNQIARSLVANNLNAAAAADQEGYMDNSTTVQLGTSLNFGNFALDGVMKTSDNGKISFQDMTYRAAATYKF